MSLDAFGTIAAKFSERVARPLVAYLAKQDESTPLRLRDVERFVRLEDGVLENALIFCANESLLNRQVLPLCRRCDAPVEADGEPGSPCDLCGEDVQKGDVVDCYFVTPESVEYRVPGVASTQRRPTMDRYGKLYASEALIKNNKIQPWETIGENDYAISLTTFTGAVESQMFDRLQRYGICLLRWQGMTPSAERLLALENTLGVALDRQNDFTGKIKAITPDEAVAANTGSSAKDLAPHTDGTQDAPLPPAMLVFEYLTTPSFGGQSNFIDMAQLLLEIPPDERDKILRDLATPRAAVCEKKGLRYEGPLVRPVSGGMALSFRLRFDDVITVADSAKASFEAIRDRVMNRASRLTYAPHEGDIVVFDNWRLLHGRHAVGGRHMRFHNRMWLGALAPGREAGCMLGVRGVPPATLALVGEENAR